MTIEDHPGLEVVTDLTFSGTGAPTGLNMNVSLSTSSSSEFTSEESYHSADELTAGAAEAAPAAPTEEEQATAPSLIMIGREDVERMEQCD